ncbi:MAG: RES family NAD+ phosphorylase [Thermomicrobiales bacterium]
MNSAQGLQLPRSAVRGVWKHAATTGYPGRILRVTPPGLTAGAANARTRFNPGNARPPVFELLYLALDPDTALLEKQAQFGNPYTQPVSFTPAPRMNRTVVVDVHVNLQHVVDLADTSAHTALATTAQELTGDWMGYEVRDMTVRQPVLTAPVGIAPTQTLGWELFHEPDIEGMRVISARDATSCCLVIFTHKLTRPGSLIWDDRNSGQVESYP